MAAIAGSWDLKIKTPIGSISATYTFAETADGLTGIATSTDESVPLADIATRITPEGERVTWRQAVTRPIRLNLDFDVTAVGDRLTGHSRAGRLPRSQVSGRRRPA
ncbi:MAG: hypothetical protein QOI78_7040 [Actinomycetota bacterium]|jgi:hypothetical protein|nr:hypothetical protein [Actinomycetota bacterium]